MHGACCPAGQRPQNHLRDASLADLHHDYPQVCLQAVMLAPISLCFQWLRCGPSSRQPGVGACTPFALPVHAPGTHPIQSSAAPNITGHPPPTPTLPSPPLHPTPRHAHHYSTATPTPTPTPGAQLKELVQRKDALVAARATPPYYLRADLRTLPLSVETFGTKFDVVRGWVGEWVWGAEWG